MSDTSRWEIMSLPARPRGRHVAPARGAGAGRLPGDDMTLRFAQAAAAEQGF